MIILSNFILIVVNVLHFWKHLRSRCCNKGIQNDFGTYPLIFFAYGILQLFFSIYLSFLCMYEIIIDMNMDMASFLSLLLYPFNTTQIVFETKFVQNMISINSFYVVNAFILFLIYIIEGFMNWYRYYTVYIAHMFLIHDTITNIFKYYTIYILIFIIFIVMSVFVHHYIAILIIILHFSFSIYCSSQQIRILESSTKQSFAKQHFKMMMAPLYPTRMYAILSTVSSTLFMAAFLCTNASMIYYPLFSSLTTFFLSLIFVRNRYFLCKCCNYRQMDKGLDGVLHYKNKKSMNRKRTISVPSPPLPLSQSTLSFDTNTTYSQPEPAASGTSNVVLPSSAKATLNAVQMNNVISKLNSSYNTHLSTSTNTESVHSAEQSDDTVADLTIDIEMDIIEEDDDVFHYQNMPSPTEIMEENKLHIEIVPVQRPSTETQIKSFWNTKIETNGATKHVKNVTAIDLDTRSTTCSQNRLDHVDLGQHLNLLQLVKCQGLMKNPLHLLRSHQRRSIGNKEDAKTRRNRRNSRFRD